MNICMYKDLDSAIYCLGDQDCPGLPCCPGIIETVGNGAVKIRLRGRGSKQGAPSDCSIATPITITDSSSLSRTFTIL